MYRSAFRVLPPRCRLPVGVQFDELRWTLPTSLSCQAPPAMRLRGFATSAAIANNTSVWEVVIGLEMHVQVSTNTKLFSAAPTSTGACPNTNVAPFDAAIPGTLPLLNWGCVEAAARTGLAIGGTVNTRSRFDRKHYFYADLPHGYQITQQQAPIVTGGSLAVQVEGEPNLTVNIQRIQLEMDTGKSVHSKEDGHTLLDLNRAGSALMEIVTDPDIRSGVQAAAFVRQLQRLLRHLGTSTANMEDGDLRVDVNVSVRNDTGLCSNRCEVKNLNSTRSIARAIEYEAARHQRALEEGGNVAMETRTFNVASGQTVLLRTKETAMDYRFMAEPDIPTLVLSEATIAALEESIPLMPDESDAAQLAMLETNYQLPAKQANTLVRIPGAVAYFEALVTAGVDKCSYLDVANWVLGDIKKELNAIDADYIQMPSSAQPKRIAEVLRLVGEGTLSKRMFKSVLSHLVKEEGDHREVKLIVEDVCGGGQLSDDSQLQDICTQVLAEYPKQVEDFRNGRKKLMGLFVGQVMKRTQGRADPKRVPVILTEMIAAAK
mmetsp:Transcript_37205/g.44968  ORF Transcript_37205/g.44968 Transcript_37205/m.44968 type:complete len:547 (-) Transcript_37205:282-1922(-)